MNDNKGEIVMPDNKKNIKRGNTGQELPVHNNSIEFRILYSQIENKHAILASLLAQRGIAYNEERLAANLQEVR